MTNEELARQIQDGNEALLLTLWKQVERWVAHEALRWYHEFDGKHGVEVRDLIQSGYIAMINALQTYDADEGSFIGWLTYKLKSEFSVLYGVRTERDRRDPLNKALSLDAPMSADDPDGDTLIDAVLDPCGEDGYQQLENRDYIRALREALESALNDIPPKNADVIRKRWLHGEAQKDIATDARVSPQEVYNRERKGFSLLRRPQTIEKLREFNPYSCTGYQAWYRSGMSVQERYVIMNDSRTHNIIERRYNNG